MQQNERKNIRITYCGKVVIACLLFFSSLQLRSQEVPDTVAVVEETPPPPGETDEDPKGLFFSYKDQYGEDSLVLGKQKLSDSLVKKMQEDDAFWYANALIAKKKKEESKSEPFYIPLWYRSWFQTLLWIIVVGGFATFLIIYLSGSNIGLFSKKKQVFKTDTEEEIPEDIFAINYQKEIDKAAAQKNYRLAVRLMYLRLLKNMSERNIIQYKQDRTNFDYLMQLHSTSYYKDFFRITRNYEYSWYGQFEVSNDAYGIIKNEFDQFEKMIH